MPTATREVSRVAKKKAGRPKGENNRGVGKPVRLDPAIVTKAKIVAMRQNIEVGRYLSDLLNASVSKDYIRVLKEMSEEAGQS